MSREQLNVIPTDYNQTNFIKHTGEKVIKNGHEFVQTIF